MFMLDIHKQVMELVRDPILHLVGGLFSMYQAICHSYAYTVHEYNLFSYPIPHLDGKRDC